MDLTKEVNSILLKYVDECEQGILEIETKVAKDALKKLKSTSPKNPKSSGHNGKHYADDWYIDTKNKKHYDHIIIANRQYQLTHLLENGHDIIRNGAKVGSADAEPHIKPVEEWAKEEAVSRCELFLGMSRRMGSNTTIKIGG